MLNRELKLDYFISRKQDFFVVSFVGALSKSTSEVLEKCQDEISASTERFYVLNFHDVSQIDISGVPSLVRLQKEVRDQEKLLIGAGAIREDEVTGNLLRALQSFR
jgi:anti-anti-sigma regulatory factor